MEPNSPKKIQFAVPLFQSHLDPQAAEHIRKRRPTPATLVIYNDPNASGKDHSNKQRSGQDESPHLPKVTHFHLDPLSEEPTDRDAVDQPSTTGAMMRGEEGLCSAFPEEAETFPEDGETQQE